MQQHHSDKSTFVPIYEQIFRTIREEILAGNLSEGLQLPPEDELALRYNTTRPTLRKGLKKLQSQGYIRQRKGKGTFVSFRSREYYRIGIYGGTATRDWRFFGQVYRGAYTAFSGVDKEFIFIDEGDDLISSINQAGCDGVLVVAARKEKLSAAIHNSLLTELPMVMLNYHHDEECHFHCVDITPYPLFPAIAFLHKAGHRRIAYITREPNFLEVNQIDRNRSYWQALADLDLERQESWCYTGIPGTPFYEIGRQGVKALWQLQNRPTAIVCPNTTISLGAWQGLTELNLRIPEDISIVGYDVPEWTNPYFATLVQPELELARKAGEILLARLQGHPPKERNLFLEISFEPRASCGTPRDTPRIITRPPRKGTK
ncbi:MAG: substrate-binding domain-containing protein [Lentisphaeria bacterium]|nr:substrate-binding domain-containing protein [Lentisphaeria bacterium]